MKRYDFEQRCAGFRPRREMVEANDGDWVRYDDHAAAIAAVTDDRDRLQNMVDQLESEIADARLEVERYMTAGIQSAINWEYRHGNADRVLAERDALLLEVSHLRRKVALLGGVW